MLKMLTYALLGGLLVYLAVCAVLYTQQRNFLYFPTPEVQRDDAQAIYLANDIANVKIWKVASGNRKAIIYFGGNAEEVSRNIQPFAAHLPGYDFYFMNYRGFSGSTGAPSETALYIDALSLYDHIAGEYETISIVGRSLGSGIATYVAANRTIERLALITPYDSIVSVAQSKFPLVPGSLLLHDKYDSAGRAGDISAPTLIITAEKDGVIPKRFTDNLVRAMTNAPLEQALIPSTDHLTVSVPAVFWNILRAHFRDD